MSKMFSKMSAGLLAVLVVTWTAGAAAPVMKALGGHVPKVVSRLSPTGRLAATNDIHLAIGLPLRNQGGLDALLEQINDPNSPNYHHYLTADEFAAQFGPTEQDYQAVVNFARANGFKVIGDAKNRTLVHVVGKVSNVENAFHVKMQTYQHPYEARQFYSPDTEPSIDAGLDIKSVYGLNNYMLPKALYHNNASRIGKAFGHFATGSSPSGSYWGHDFRNAYAPGVTNIGTGQKVAMFECDGYFNSDVQSYLTASGLPSVALTNVLIDGFNGQPSGSGGEVEVALDIDMAISMAPGLSQIIVYETPGDSPAFNLDMLNRIATDNLARQISSSWLIDDTPQFTQIYQQFALQGQSFFQASGDSGSYYPGIFQFEDSPWVTLVGGTTLTSTGPGGVWATETVWNNGFDPFSGHEDAGGGGVSGVYSIPSWQTWINMTTNKGSTTFRNIPDVALTADNIYIFGDGQALTDVGGTSVAAPLWAGFMALVNEQLTAKGKNPIGFINPTIYALAQTTNYTAMFHDTVTGNNTNDVNTNLYFAVPGYDLCTGLGTPNGSNFINALVGTNGGGGIQVNPVIVSAPPGPWSTNLASMNGGNPNGDWFLFVQDDKQQDVGMINSGWMVTLTTANPVGYPADNALYVSQTNVTVTPGTNFSLTLSVTNYGPSASTNVTVTDALPLPVTGVTLVSSNLTLGTITLQPGSFVWNAGNLPVGAGGTLTLNFAANTMGSYVNTPVVSAAGGTPDPNPDDNTAVTVITVGVSTPPTLTGSVSSGSGNHFTFHVDDSGGPISVIIQASTNLMNWVNIYTNTTPFDFTDLNATNYPDRFYRAIIGP
jgi:uncharacterized repeat protein (TIGR01451 family)